MECGREVLLSRSQVHGCRTIPFARFGPSPRSEGPRLRCVKMEWLAVSSSKEGLMGVLDMLKSLVGRHKGEADRGVDNRAEYEAGGTSPRLSDVDSGEESEIDIEQDRHR